MGVTTITFGTRLRRRMKTLGLTTEDVADALGVHRTTVWRWETGRGEPQSWTQRLILQRLTEYGQDLNAT